MIEDAPSALLCERNTEQLLMLHEVGLSIGISKWSKNLHEFPSISATKVSVSSFVLRLVYGHDEAFSDHDQLNLGEVSGRKFEHNLNQCSPEFDEDQDTTPVRQEKFVMDPCHIQTEISMSEDCHALLGRFIDFLSQLFPLGPYCLLVPIFTNIQFMLIDGCLYVSTNGFKEKELLGIGGFGRVYRGKLPTSKIEVAVKRVSHDSRQGINEFVAEIVSVGRVRHRNLVRLLGYCRRKGELLLVYEFMPNKSLDKFLFDQPKVRLTWSHRFRIIKGVASGLFYLHKEWEQVVIHRDVKSSNVLLDGELNGRLGDFGLAKLYDHGSNPQTTDVVRTLGYLAPELTRTGKATTSTDVFAFGVFLLEVACGRRPIGPLASGAEDLNLVDWVFTCWKRGAILETSDPNLSTDYVREEMELVLKLGLLCSHSLPVGRPSMRQVVQYLNEDLPVPELASLAMGDCGLTFGNVEAFDDFAVSSPKVDDYIKKPLYEIT